MEGPEEVFPGMTSLEWVERLCRLLIKHEKQIKEYLRDRGYDCEFSNKIADWWETLPPDCEEAGRRLFEICDQFGVIEFMVTSSLFYTFRLRGVRGRNVCSMHRRLKEMMKNIAKSFS